MIEARELSKVYGDTTAVDGIDFQVKPGHVTGFLGPNGAGKSTTMRMILGLDLPTSGTVTVDGRRYQGKVWPLHDVGALLDARAVHPGRSAYNHLHSLAAANGIARKRVDEVLGEVARVEVRAAYPQRLAADLRTAGAQVTVEPDGTLSVSGLGSKQIGELAAGRGHVLHQLRDVTVSLEEAYFRLTGESVEYRAPAPVAA